MTLPQPSRVHNLVERAIERVIFASRWLLAPIYAGLSAGLLVLLVKFAQHAVELVSRVLTVSVAETIVGVLELIDLALMGSLLLIVIFAGYENFVAKLDAAGIMDKPGWMGQVDFIDLKLKLMGSIVAISAIRLLECFMNLGDRTNRDLAWSVGIHLSLVVSGVLLAVMDRLGRKANV